MEGIQKFIIRFLIFLLLTGHFALIAFFFAPSSKLFSLVIEQDIKLLQASVIPVEVASFLGKNNIEITADYSSDNLFGRLSSEILELRRNRFMNDTEQLALNLSLLDFGSDIIGVQSASEYYFKKPLSELSATQWITLVNLHKMFLK